MKFVDFAIILFLFLASINSPLPIYSEATPGTNQYYVPPKAYIKFDPQVVRPYQTVNGSGELNINLICISYRLEYDKTAQSPRNVDYYNLPVRPFLKGLPKWVNEGEVYYYESGFYCSLILKRYITFQTSTAYMYDYHYGAVGEVFLGVYAESYFVGENIR